MKYIIKIYVDGKVKETNISTDGYDWKWLDKKYTNHINAYIDRGWKHAVSSSCGYEGFDLIYNEKKRKSIYFSHINDTLLDIKDADGKEISLHKTYTNDYGDIYSFGLGCFKSDGKFYIRKHLPRNSWSDSHDPSQEQIDTLKLHVKENQYGF